jgi:GNAT superfamily N-acetyltransferase
MSKPFRFRFATPDDAELITNHRRWMFEDIGGHDPVKLDAMDAAFLIWVRKQLATGEYIGWFALNEIDEPVAGAGLWMRNFLPGPEEATHIVQGHVVNVYTNPDYRRKQLARKLMEQIIEWCHNRNIRTITLHASRFGRDLYLELGFKTDNTLIMHLDR